MKQKGDKHFISTFYGVDGEARRTLKSRIIFRIDLSYQNHVLHVSAEDILVLNCNKLMLYQIDGLKFPFML